MATRSHRRRPATDVDTLVRQVLDAVAARVPVDEREQRSIERVLGVVPALAHPFDEHADPVHITGSAFIVGPRGVVLLRHRRLGIWVQPGGHVDPGETPWDAARREAVEETGLPVHHLAATPELFHVDVHAGGRGHTHLDLRYLFAADDADPAPPAEESQDVGWFSWADAPTVAEPDLGGALAALATRFA
jgi:8-oxo-dGTP pyrophosphatase MutT (NUDIX family)